MLLFEIRGLDWTSTRCAGPKLVGKSARLVETLQCMHVNPIFDLSAAFAAIDATQIREAQESMEPRVARVPRRSKKDKAS